MQFKITFYFLRYQIICCALTILFGAGISVPPSFGVCTPHFNKEFKICQFQKHDLPCDTYMSFYVTLGILAPTSAVIAIYCYVFRIIMLHRRRNKSNYVNSCTGSFKVRTEDKSSTVLAKKILTSSMALGIVPNVSSDGPPTVHNEDTKDFDYEEKEEVMRYDRGNLQIPKIKITDVDDKECPKTPKEEIFKFTGKKGPAFFNNDQKGGTFPRSRSQDKENDRTRGANIVFVNKVAVEFNDDNDISINITTETDVSFKSSQSTATINTTCLTTTNTFLNKSATSTTTNKTTINKSSPLSSRTTFTGSTADLLSPHKMFQQEVAKETKPSPHTSRAPLEYIMDILKKANACKSENNEPKKDQIPWSLVLLTLMHIFSSLPWIIIEFYSDYFFKASTKELIFLDLGNTILMVSVAVSPLLYIFFTRLVRDKVKQTAKNFYKSCKIGFGRVNSLRRISFSSRSSQSQ